MNFFLKLFAVLLVVAAIFIASIPSILRSDWGREQLLSWINHRIPGKMEIRKVDLHWSGEQTIEGIVLQSLEGQPIIEVEKFFSEASLWKLLCKSTHLGFTEVKNLHATLITNDKGETNLQRALRINGRNAFPLPHSTITLSNVNGQLHLFQKNHPFSISIQGSTEQEGLPGQFQIDVVLGVFTADHWNNFSMADLHRQATIEAHITHFPVDLIDRLVALKNPHFYGFFHSLLGNELNLDIHQETNQEKLLFNLTTDSPLMRGSIEGKIENQIVSIASPSSFDFHLQPESINPYMQHLGKLTQPTNMHVAISHLSFPLTVVDSEQTIDPSLFAFQAALLFENTKIFSPIAGPISLDHFQIELKNNSMDQYDSLAKGKITLDPTQESYAVSLHSLWKIAPDKSIEAPSNHLTIENELFHIDSTFRLGSHHAFESTINFTYSNKNKQSSTLTASIEVLPEIKQQIPFSLQIHSLSPINLQGSLRNVVDANGKWNSWKEIGIEATANGSHLTPHILQGLFFLSDDQTDKVTALCGSSFDATIHCDMQGTTGSLQASLTGERTTAEIDAQIVKGVLQLNKPFTAQVRVDPFFAKTFFPSKIPLLSSIVEGENPMIVSISPEGFVIPLFPFKKDEIRITKGVLTLGKMHFHQEEELQSLLQLLKWEGEPFVPLWFTPIYFAIHDGKLSFQRVDILLANRYTLASWGTIDLIGDQADLFLGLTAQTLQTAFGVKKLNKEYVLQIPLRFTEGTVEIDKKKIGRKISSLVAQTNGGLGGKLLGEFLDLTLPRDDEEVPPPTTQPFPWENEFFPLSDESVDHPKKGKKKNKSDKSVEEQLLEFLNL